MKEAGDVLSEYGIQLVQYPTERIEIQSDDPAKIAEYSLNQIPDNGRPMLVEDAGLFIDHYGGFRAHTHHMLWRNWITQVF